MPLSTTFTMTTRTLQTQTSADALHLQKSTRRRSDGITCAPSSLRELASSPVCTAERFRARETNSLEDAYDLFAVNLVTTMLGVVFWQNAKTNPGKIPSKADTAIKVATSTGTVIGQVGFGGIILPNSLVFLSTNRL
jgi:hypothetical protein